MSDSALSFIFPLISFKYKNAYLQQNRSCFFLVFGSEALFFNVHLPIIKKLTTENSLFVIEDSIYWDFPE